ncbi:hypothetical protein KKE60_08160 [Patescibacteria group bacterium]|nr:hypothetical protein [Patescibacteria group bacterium]
MKCKVFKGTWYDAADAFNRWAKGKVLTRDIIIHTQVTERIEGCDTTSPTLMIIAFYPEDSNWDKEPVAVPNVPKAQYPSDAVELAATA